MNTIGKPLPNGVVEASRDEICNPSDLSDKAGPLPRILLPFLIFAFCPSSPS